jgi:hypothetical protein
VVWYGNASWSSRRPSTDATPSYLVQYDVGGREIVRQILPPLPFTEPSPTQALTGFVTPLAGYVLRGCAAEYLGDHAAWSLGMAAHTLIGFTTLMLLSAVVFAVASFVLAHRYALSTTHCVGWSLCGFLFGPTGLLLLLALHEWPALVTCHHCRKPRVVTRDTCEHCDTPHAPPAADGTEIFEPAATAPHTASASC